MGHRLRKTTKILMGHRCCRLVDSSMDYGYSYNLKAISLQITEFLACTRHHIFLPITIFFPVHVAVVCYVEDKHSHWLLELLLEHPSGVYTWSLSAFPTMSTGPLSAADLQVSSLLSLVLISFARMLTAHITH